MIIKILILLKADYWYTTKQECKDTDFDLVERVTGIFFFSKIWMLINKLLTNNFQIIIFNNIFRNVDTKRLFVNYGGINYYKNITRFGPTSLNLKIIVSI